jgi:hypothetical protein
MHRERWQSTDRDTETLVKESLMEVARAIGDGATTEPGPASLELAVRAAYPLVVTGRLGGNQRDLPDRRTPGEVLDALRRTAQGIHQLAQSLRDFGDNRNIRAVNEDGSVRRLADDSGDQVVSDVFLREEYPPPGKGRAKRTGDTPTEQLHNRMVDFGQVMDRLTEAFAAIGKVAGDDGNPLVEYDGADPLSCAAWRQVLQEIDDELTIWGRTFRKRYGTPPELLTGSAGGSADDNDSDESADEAYEGPDEQWNDETKESESEATE